MVKGVKRVKQWVNDTISYRALATIMTGNAWSWTETVVATQCLLAQCLLGLNSLFLVALPTHCQRL